MGKEQHVIYALCDADGQARYIGYTSEPDRRLLSHHQASQLKRKTRKNNWIKFLLAKSCRADMIILEVYATAEELPQAEIELIEYYKSIGCDLVNGTSGGDGGTIGMKHLEETKLKISKSSTGKIFSTEHRRKLSEANRKRKHSEASKKKISESEKGRIVSETTKQKLSLANSGKQHTEVSKKKISENNGMKDKKHTDEARKKITEARLGKHRIVIDGKIKYI